MHALSDGIAIVSGPPGSGKTSLVAAALSRAAQPAVWCDASAREGSAGVRPWVDAALDGAVRAGVPLVLDNAEAIDRDTLLATATRVAAVADGRLVVVGRGLRSESLRPCSCAATGADLRLTPDDAARLLARVAPASRPDERRALVSSAEGWLMGLLLGGEALERGDVVGSVADYIDREVIAGLDPLGLALLRRIALAESPDRVPVRPGDEVVAARLIEADALCETWDGPGGLRLHPMLRATLRRSAAEAPASLGRVLIVTMGRLSLQSCGRRTPSSAFRRQKARELLAILCSGHGPMHRELLIDALWGDSERDRALSGLHSTVYCLRRALALTAGPVPAVLVEGETYELDLGPGCVIDADEFLATARRALSSGDPLALASAEAAYGGPFLPEWPYAPWSEMRRAEVENARQRVLEARAEALAAAGAFWDAVERYRLLLAAEPEGERFHRGLMMAYASAGDRALAVRQFHRCRKLLRDALGLEPGATTQALYRRLLDGNPVPSPWDAGFSRPLPPVARS